MLRTHSTRTRAITAAGALGTTMAVAGGVALAQTPAPAPAETAPAQAAAAPAKSKLVVGRRRLNVRVGRVAYVRGTLLPRSGSRIVRLERLQGRRWRQIDADVTSRSGHYALRVRTRTTGTAPVRVRFGGDRTAKASSRVVGRLNAYRPALASWYGPGLYGNHLG